MNELIKDRHNKGKKNNLYFYRDGSQKEIDVIYSIGNHYLPIEIKSAETFTKDFLKNLDYFEKLFPDLNYGKLLICATTDEQKRQNTHITNPREMLEYINTLDEH